MFRSLFFFLAASLRLWGLMPSAPTQREASSQFRAVSEALRGAAVLIFHPHWQRILTMGPLKFQRRMAGLQETCCTRLSVFAQEMWIMLLSCVTFPICGVLTVTKTSLFKWLSHQGTQPLITMRMSDCRRCLGNLESRVRSGLGEQGASASR